MLPALDAGTVLESVPLLICAGFVYFQCAGPSYSHYRGPFFYKTQSDDINVAKTDHRREVAFCGNHLSIGRLVNL